MQQKIQFVTTVLHEPSLLIFDEPFSGFDPINARLLKEEILSLREKGATIIFSTHNMESVEELCDHITLIDRSRSILDGSVKKIRKEWAANEYLVEFEGEAVVKSNSHYDVLDSVSEQGRVNVRLKTSDKISVNDILKEMVSFGSVASFNPALPSMNEIFIRVVEANTTTSNSEKK
jgi:ABC-2 type transport system ATP-binding protein